MGTGGQGRIYRIYLSQGFIAGLSNSSYSLLMNYMIMLVIHMVKKYQVTKFSVNYQNQKALIYYLLLIDIIHNSFNYLGMNFQIVFMISCLHMFCAIVKYDNRY